MNHIELHRRFPLSIVDSPSQQPLVLFHYSFAPTHAAEEEKGGEPLLKIAPNGSSASLITKTKTTKQLENANTPIESEFCLSGTATLDNNQRIQKSDYILRITDENDSFQLLPTSIVAGLKRDRKNDFFNVKDSVSKSARTSLKEKTRTISHARRKVPASAPKASQTAASTVGIAPKESISVEEKELNPASVDII